ncbi:unnamed protein product [Rhodiola kirilowii]
MHARPSGLFSSSIRPALRPFHPSIRSHIRTPSPGHALAPPCFSPAIHAQSSCIHPAIRPLQLVHPTRFPRTQARMSALFSSHSRSAIHAPCSAIHSHTRRLFHVSARLLDLKP